MAKIWKVTFISTYIGQYSFTDKKLYYTEKEMLKAIKKIDNTNGTIEVFESDKQKIPIEAFLDSLKRDIQLGTILDVSTEMSVLQSKFINLLSKSKLKKDVKDSIIKEWEFLSKSDVTYFKKFFAKYRNTFLLETNYSVEWYHTLLSLYNYGMISNISKSDWFYSSTDNRYIKKNFLIKEVTEEQKNNFIEAKSLIKKEKKSKK
jgi:hypothetical protein